MITREKILSAVEHLPALGTTFARLTDLEQDESADLEDFAEVVKGDPALMGNLLRQANSAEYGLSKQVSSATQAVAVLGTRKVLAVAMATAFRGVLPRTLAGYGIDAGAFWRHSIAVGVLSEILGEETGVGSGEENFVAGLLHDIGKLVTSIYLEGESDRVLRSIRDEDLLLVEAERTLLGLDHCEVGLAVARKWNLPPGICAVARWHHSPGTMRCREGDTEVLRPFADVVHVADCLAHAFGYGTDLGELSREIDPGAMARLGLHAPALEEVVCRAAAEIEARIESLNTGK